MKPMIESIGAVGMIRRQDSTNGQAHNGLDCTAINIWACGDLPLRKEIVARFLLEYPRLLAEVRDSITKNDCERLSRSAQTMEGRFALFGIHSACGAAWELETMGRTHNLARAQQVITEIETEIEITMRTPAFLALEK
jgi:hypothetical protein